MEEITRMQELTFEQVANQTKKTIIREEVLEEELISFCKWLMLNLFIKEGYDLKRMISEYQRTRK